MSRLAKADPLSSVNQSALNVVVEERLVGVQAQAHLVNLVAALVVEIDLVHRDTARRGQISGGLGACGGCKGGGPSFIPLKKFLFPPLHKPGGWATFSPHFPDELVNQCHESKILL